MDDVVNRFAKELADAIAAAVAENPQVEACRAQGPGGRVRDACHSRGRRGVREPEQRRRRHQDHDAGTPAARERRSSLTANDRRFLRSLRIGADEAKETGRVGSAAVESWYRRAGRAAALFGLWRLALVGDGFGFRLTASGSPR